MKRLVLIIAVLSISLSLYANTEKLVDYVVTSTGVVYYKNISYGFSDENYLVCKTDTGEKITYSFDEIVRFRKSGITYDKLPLIENQSITDKMVFMEYLKYKNGLQVYKYSTINAAGEEYSELYVFSNDRFVVDFTSQNYETLTDFFNL